MESNSLQRKREIVEGYRKSMLSYVEQLQRLYAMRQIDRATYEGRINQVLEGKTPLQWIAHYDETLNRYKEDLYVTYATQEGGKKTSLLVVLALLSLVLIVSLTSLTPALTGFSIRGVASDPLEEHATTYGNEGTKWVDIKGQRTFERCMKVSTPIAFSEVEITGKVTSATQSRNLHFVLYNDDSSNNEPGLEVGSCEVASYSDMWKSCMVKSESAQPGEYWICASSPKGDADTTYYTIAYQSGDNKRTAFWTGSNWQKLEWNSYTIKALFRNYG